MDPRLYECALAGDVFRLRQLISGDEHILEISETANWNGNNILHIASIYGYVDFAREVLSAKPELSSELNGAGLSPLHLAAAKGHLGIIKLLLAVDPDLSSLKDKHGRLPAHAAAMKGRVDVLKVITSVNPWCLKEKTDRGETVLHLSVKENRIGVVEFLMSLEEVKSMVNEGDCSGNTALHLATARNRIEVIRILTSNSPVDLNASNKYNVTPVELLNQRLTGSIRNEDDEMVRLLSPSDAPVPAATDHSTEPKTKRAWIVPADLSDNLIIVAILIATVTFQAAVTPPGGLWQDDPADLTNKPAVAAISPSALSPSVSPTPQFQTCKGPGGTAVLCATTYDQFMRFDAWDFLLSLIFIVLVVLSKCGVVQEEATVLWLVPNLGMAIVLLGVAFYHAIKATKPLGSKANERFLGDFKLLCIPVFFALVVFNPSIMAICKRKLRPPRA